MTPFAFFLVLTSAGLHATWNVLAKKSGASFAFYAMLSMVGALWSRAIGFFTPIHFLDLPQSFHWWFAGTLVAEFLYALGLKHSYRALDMSTAYPMMRALPLLLLPAITSTFGIGKPLGPHAFAGMAMVFAGCLAIPIRSFSDVRLSRYLQSGFGWVLVVALGTTGYTLCDSQAQRAMIDFAETGGIALSKPLVSLTYYSIRVFAVCVLLWVVVACSHSERAEAATIMRARSPMPFIAGVCSSLTYILVLCAMNFVSNVAYVQAFRQIGLLFGLLEGIFILKERCTAPKVVGLVLILAGLAVSVLPAHGAFGPTATRQQADDSKGALAMFVIAERGKAPDCAIVIPSEAPKAVRYAAEELRDFTEKTTGVRLPIVENADAARKAVVLEVDEKLFTNSVANVQMLPIANSQSPIEKWNMDLDIGNIGNSHIPLSPDAFRLSVSGDRLHVVGDGPGGVLYGVYELLERFAGCRWYASWHTVAPELDRFEVPPDLDETHSPAFAMREPHWHDVLKHPEFAARLRVNSRSWCRTEEKYGGEPCRFGGGLDICHTFSKLMPVEEFFDEHPEYFSMVGGRRVRENTQLCLTNPDVLRIVTERVLGRIRRDPGARFYGVSQNDNPKGCQCPSCKAVDEEEGSRAGTLVRFLNALGEAVEREFPDAVIETLAYQYTRHPPKKTRLRHNVVPCLCTIECDFATPLDRSPYRHNVEFLADIKGWSAQTDGLLIWDYTTDFSHFTLPFANVRSLQGNLRFFRDNGAKFIYEEGDHKGRHADFAELKTWLLAKWMWNPELPEEALLDDFFNGYYGAGAPFVRRYFDELHLRQAEWSANPENPLLIFDGTENPALSDEFLAEATSLWAKAAEAVKDDPVRSYNVRMGAFSIDYVRISRSAKLVRFTSSGALSPDENRALAQSLLDRMAEAGDIRLCLGKDEARVNKLRALANGTYAPAPVVDGRVEVEERHLGLSGRGKFGDIVDDPLAEDGRAIKLFNTHFEWCTTFGMDNCAFKPEDKYVLSIRVRVESAADGEAFWAGVYDKVEECGRGGIEPQTSDVSNEYRWYDVLTWEPRRSEYLWIGPGRFGKDGKSAVKAVWIDKIAFRPSPQKAD